jgi:N6-adenosine-specific RNA methylase IME4
MSWPLFPLQRHHYRCCLLDPPWRFVAGTKSRPQHYARMNDQELAELPVRQLADPEGCWFFVWCTSPKARDLFRLAEAWGLRYSGRGFVWIKTGPGGGLHLGQGFTTRKNAEDCWLFKIGKPPRLAKDVHEVLFSPVREHSRKPDEIFARIERFCAGPRCELFGREHRPGWDAFGNEAGKFDRLQPNDRLATAPGSERVAAGSIKRLPAPKSSRAGVGACLGPRRP